MLQQYFWSQRSSSGFKTNFRILSCSGQVQTVHPVIIHFHRLVFKKRTVSFFNREDPYYVSKIALCHFFTTSKRGFPLVLKSYITLVGKNLIWALLDQNVNYILYLEKQQQGPTVFKTLKDRSFIDMDGPKKITWTIYVTNVFISQDSTFINLRKNFHEETLCVLFCLLTHHFKQLRN